MSYGGKHDGATVLVADDDAASRLVAGTALQGAGFRVIEASNGAEAIERFRAQRPQIVLLDVVMPVMDGFTACAEIRALPGGQDTPILMLTGLEDVESIHRAYEVGATDFATKPVPWAILVHRVRYMLRSRGALDALRESETRLAAAQQIARLANWECDLDTGTTRISEEVSLLFGIPAEQNVASLSDLLPLVHPEDRDLARHALEEMNRGREFESFDFRVALPDGSVRHLHHQARLIPAAEGRPPRLAGTFQDITQRKAAEERVRFLAHYDELTQLPNRLLLVDRLRLALSSSRRASRKIAVLFLDLDRFKRINDTLGHSAGDALLRAVSARLRGCVRDTDTVGRQGEPGAGSTIARFGGDEFIIILPDLTRGVDAARVARRILEALVAPFMLEEHEVSVGGSIGISLCPDDGQDVETLLKNADTAMYHAKEAGRGRYQFYAESMNAVAFQRLSMEGSLRRALARGEFTLHYQPQVDVMAGRVFGAEALLRWHHPDLGLVPPGDFIPLAEETGLIVPIGDWVIRSACAQGCAWRELGVGDLTVSVNVSSQQFWQPTFVSSVAASLEAAGLPAECLELEITESVLMRTGEETVKALHQLREMGLRIAIDDFGTGYSSLSYLRRFPVSSLKIDRSFIRRIATDPDDASLVGAIITMARSLKLEAVAEGVETIEQLETLRGLGCRLVQGFLFARPAPPAEVASYLSNPHVLDPILVRAGS